MTKEIEQAHWGATPTPLGPGGEAPPPLRLLAEVGLAEAAHLARAGRLTEAAAVLSDLPAAVSRSERVLDLRARIKAQMGHLEEAKAMWTEASRLDPENHAYARALGRLQKMPRAWARALPGGLPATILFGIGSLLLAGYGLTRFFTLGKMSDADRPAQTVGAGTSLQTTQPDNEAPPDLVIEHPDVSTRIDGHQLVVTLRSGLFSSGTRLKPEARDLLTSIGRSLFPYAGKVSVVVVGHTDNLQVRVKRGFRDNLDLGMRRAVLVLNHLKGAAHLPPSMLYAQSLGEHESPFPNDSPEGRAHNRTVSLRITRTVR